ncbi:MAG TPA: alpha/beta hydrolase-fold protein [Terrimesophilobacter sp.]|nr:alpha/beta hydrolase-fold protein [Terrimesophilobacter sp.]
MSERRSDDLHSSGLDAGSTLWNIPLEERSGKPLLVMMHGLGSHEGDLFGLNRFLPPGLVVASLRAPLEYGGGFAWFQAGSPSSSPDTTLLDASVQGVLDWLDRLDFEPSGVGLMGFSQGGCMALQLLRTAPDRFDYALQLSGFVADVDHPGDEVLAARTPRVPVFWAHGDFDPVIPPDAVKATGEWLAAHTALEAQWYPMEHTVSQEELADLVRFVSAQLAAGVS